VLQVLSASTLWVGQCEGHSACNKAFPWLSDPTQNNFRKRGWLSNVETVCVDLMSSVAYSILSEIECKSVVLITGCERILLYATFILWHLQHIACGWGSGSVVWSEFSAECSSERILKVCQRLALLQHIECRSGNAEFWLEFRWCYNRKKFGSHCYVRFLFIFTQPLLHLVDIGGMWRVYMLSLSQHWAIGETWSSVWEPNILRLNLLNVVSLKQLWQRSDLTDLVRKTVYC